MSIHLDPRTLISGEFGCLEPAEAAWQDQHDYWEDFNARFFRSNGVAYDPAQHSNVEAWLNAPDRAPFSAMTDRLLDEMAVRVDLSDVDLVLLAHWMPDLHLGTSVTNFAQHKLGLTDGFGFAISDRGRSAPLFALNCAARYLKEDRRKALLLVMDQKHLLYRSDLVDRLKPSNAASAMVLDTGATDGLRYAGYTRRHDVPAEDAATAIDEICLGYGLERGRTTVVVDPALAEASARTGPVIVQEPRKLCSAPFAALAEADAPLGDTILVTHDETELVAVVLRGPAEGTA